MSNVMTSVRKWVKRQSNPTQQEVGNDVSGVRPIPQEERHIAPPIHVRDNEVMYRTFVNESDMMLWLSRHDYFLRHADYKQEVQEYLVSHFLNVFTFHPESGKVRVHGR